MAKNFVIEKTWKHKGYYCVVIMNSSLGFRCGENGLEGFYYGEKYRYEYKESDKNNKPYYRVYPILLNDYYETCGPLVFNKYFKKI